jgi:hypothetical protein
VSEPTGGKAFVSIAEAARVLEVSERQARRYAGQLTDIDRQGAGHDAGHKKGAQVRLSAMIHARNAAKGATVGSDAGQVPDTAPDTLEADAGQMAATPDTPYGAQIGGELSPLAARYVAQLESEVEFLKGTIEAERREAALTIAALRDAIKAMPRALPEPGEDSGDSGAQDGSGGAQLSPTGATVPEQTERRDGLLKRAKAWLVGG